VMNFDTNLLSYLESVMMVRSGISLLLGICYPILFIFVMA
jgi:hypothetical protein